MLFTYVGTIGQVALIDEENKYYLAPNVALIRSIDDIKGKALENLKSFDEMKIEPAVSTVKSVPCTENCEKCRIVCLYGAIRKEKDTVVVDSSKCNGCGLCTFICPVKKLKLEW